MDLHAKAISLETINQEGDIHFLNHQFITWSM